MIVVSTLKETQYSRLNCSKPCRPGHTNVTVLDASRLVLTSLEAVNGYRSDLLHGEAVGTGMALALRYSARLGLMSSDEAERGVGLIAQSGLETRLAHVPGGPYAAAPLVAAMQQDKKARAGKVPLILAKGLGKSFIYPDADLSDVQAFLQEELQKS